MPIPLLPYMSMGSGIGKDCPKKLSLCKVCLSVLLEYSEIYNLAIISSFFGAKHQRNLQSAFGPVRLEVIQHRLPAKKTNYGRKIRIKSHPIDSSPGPQLSNDGWYVFEPLLRAALTFLGTDEIQEQLLAESALTVALLARNSREGR